jgi:hypothetical protein
MARSLTKYAHRLSAFVRDVCNSFVHVTVAALSLTKRVFTERKRGRARLPNQDVADPCPPVWSRVYSSFKYKEIREVSYPSPNANAVVPTTAHAAEPRNYPTASDKPQETPENSHCRLSTFVFVS